MIRGKSLAQTRLDCFRGTRQGFTIIRVWIFHTAIDHMINAVQHHKRLQRIDDWRDTIVRDQLNGSLAGQYQLSGEGQVLNSHTKPHFICRRTDPNITGIFGGINDLTTEAVNEFSRQITLEASAAVADPNERVSRRRSRHF
jgi:hypothetical protein